MPKNNSIDGKELMIFIDGMAVALATSHRLTINAETSDSASKDDGKWKKSKVTKLGWEAITEALVSVDENANSYDVMYDKLIACEEVDVISGRPANASNDGVPEAGWTAPDSVHYKGKALITSLERNDPNDGNSTMTITLQGNGKLEKVTV